MRPINVNRKLVFVAGLFANVFSWGIVWMAVYSVSEIYTSIASGVGVIKINLVELWVPVGFLGVGFISLVSPAVALITGKRSDYVWGEKGNAVATYSVFFFAVLGVFVAMYLYQSIKGHLDERKYVYCKPATMLSAITQHEKIYVVSSELCVKPRKIP